MKQIELLFQVFFQMNYLIQCYKQLQYLDEYKFFQQQNKIKVKHNLKKLYYKNDKCSIQLILNTIYQFISISQSKQMLLGEIYIYNIYLRKYKKKCLYQIYLRNVGDSIFVYKHY
ncbi:hypothetical protein pb186bvf_019496 [Paramecium bursaria]